MMLLFLFKSSILGDTTAADLVGEDTSGAAEVALKRLGENIDRASRQASAVLGETSDDDAPEPETPRVFVDFLPNRERGDNDAATSSGASRGDTSRGDVFADTDPRLGRTPEKREADDISPLLRRRASAFPLRGVSTSSDDVGEEGDTGPEDDVAESPLLSNLGNDNLKRGDPAPLLFLLIDSVSNPGNFDMSTGVCST